MSLSSTLLVALLLLPAGTPDSGPVILDFHASWCEPCRQMRPVVSRLIEKDYPVRSIDVDQHRELASRYKITGVPTFVVVDGDGRELGRASGVLPASELAALYNDAFSRLRPDQPAPEPEPAAVARAERAAESAAVADAPAAPKPWQTVVRIRVFNRGSVGFGSGTVVYSDADESVILTCAHIFSVEGARKQPAPREFASKIQVDLFDGRLHGLKPAMVHPVESVAAEVIDYDFNADVGLIRIRPGRVLPSSPVVPDTWTPTPGVMMTTVGCSEGNNATAWSTRITNPEFRGMVNNTRYDAIECEHAPLQGRSGGGLYTIDGYVAGVCNFAEPRGNHGLYASPRSIHKMLDQNDLTLCYRPDAGSSDRLLASRGGSSRTTVRAQNASLPGAGEITIPDPERVGVRLDPITSMTERQRPVNRAPVAAAASWRAQGDSPSPETELLASGELEPEIASDGRVLESAGPRTVDLQMSPEAAGDPVPRRSSPGPARPRAAEPVTDDGGWRTGSQLPPR